MGMSVLLYLSVFVYGGVTLPVSVRVWECYFTCKCIVVSVTLPVSVWGFLLFYLSVFVAESHKCMTNTVNTTICMPVSGLHPVNSGTFRMKNKKDMHYNTLCIETKRKQTVKVESYKRLLLEHSDIPMKSASLLL